MCSVSNQIAVLGAGYVGLTTAACLTTLQHTVTCADIDADRVAHLQRGEVPILEEGLDDLVREGLSSGLLTFTTDVPAAVAGAEFVYLCVPTPQGADGSPDLSYIEAAAEQVSEHLQPDSVVINKSTVPVGSTLVVGQALGRGDVHVVSNPEFLREGSAVHDFLHPDRVVIGADDQAAAIRVAALYVGLAAPLMVTDPASAELIKYASNAFLASKVSFVNAIAALCEVVGADVNDVVLGMGYDKRIGHEFLRPGPGWGGSCFMAEETVLARRGDTPHIYRLDELHDAVQVTGPDGWEVLAWRSGEPTPEFLPVAAFTAREYDGDVVDVRTKMGRRISVTADHPFVVGDGLSGDPLEPKTAVELTDSDWLPVAQGSAFPAEEPREAISLLEAAELVGLADNAIIMRLNDVQLAQVRRLGASLAAARRRDILRCGSMRLHELRALGINPAGGAFGTTTNGTFVPAGLALDERFWHMLGLFLAEGHISTDGARTRVAWSFHPTDEWDLVEAVAGYWQAAGVKVDVRRVSTTMQVSVSSRILAALFSDRLGVGANAYCKRLPDLAWSSSDECKRALLRGLWDGDGSWSWVNRSANAVLEYGTVSRELADGMLRLLGDLGVMARLKVGRTARSTTDTFWLAISGADQVADAHWLLPDEEWIRIRAHSLRLTKRNAPNGYRRLSKNAAWVRVVSADRRRFTGTVYSLEVPLAHTVVSTHGLVVHNCFPKDTRALVHIAEGAGYDFDLLRGVIAVNEEQFVRVVDRVSMLAGGLKGVKVAVWGVTFKARTDDVRDSPAVSIMRRLVDQGAIVRAHDPAVSETLSGLPEVELHDDPYAVCEGADVLLVLTEWDEFRWLDFDKVRSVMAQPRIFDARNVLDHQTLRRRGFEYQAIGRS